MQVQRLVAAVLGGVGVALLAVAQFTPWGTFDAAFAGIDVDVDAYMWQVKSDVSADEIPGGGGSEDHSWYDDEFDDRNGSGKVRTGAPLLASSLGLVAIGTALAALLARPFGSIVLGLGVGLGVAGIIVFSIGVNDIFEGDQDWGIAFYFAIIGTSLALLAGVAALVPDRFVPKAKAGAKADGPSY